MVVLTKGNSMYPTLIDGKTYDVEIINSSNIDIGDIIVYYIEDKIICHRIVEIFHAKSGQLFIKTKGDNCNEADPYAVTLDMVVGKITYNA